MKLFEPQVLIIILVIVLIIFGPKKLPEIGRQIGKAMNEFKRASNEFKAQIESEIANIERDTTPQILPPNQAPMGAVASGTLIDAPPATHVPEQLSAESEPSPKAPDA